MDDLIEAVNGFVLTLVALLTKTPPGNADQR
jgi:hypothetical protein